MKIPKSGQPSDFAVIDLASDFRQVIGRGVRKRLAREHQVSPETIKRWFAGHWPASRRRELGETLLRHVARQKSVLGEIEARARLLARG